MTTFKKTKVGMKTSDLEGTAGYHTGTSLLEIIAHRLTVSETMERT
jgi:hypothetical protein